MMETTAFFNAKASLQEVSLFIDINPKNDTVKEFFYSGKNASKYSIELDELKILVVGKTLGQIQNIKRSDLKFVTELPGHKAPMLSLGMSLLRAAINDYSGESRSYKEEKDMVCLCFSVTKKDIVQGVLGDKDFELKTLIQKTMASSACGSCRPMIEKIILETRHSHGLIKGLDHSRSRFDANGNWIKILGLYPGALLIELERLKLVWMKREGIIGQYQIEFMNIEGFHLDVKITPSSEKTNAGLISALSDYLKSELGILFFLHAVD